MARHYLALLLGVYCASTAVIFLKLSGEHAIWLSAERLLVAGVALLPLFGWSWWRHRRNFAPRMLWRCVLPGCMLGLHFISWIFGARMTPAANATLIVNLTPVVLPFFMWWMHREALTRRELVGTAVALSGLALLAGGDLSFSGEYLQGDLICALSLVVFCYYLSLARRNRGFPVLWLYVTPMYLVGGLFCAGVALAVGAEPLGSYRGRELAWILGLGLVPTVFGHSLLNAGMKRLRGQAVGMVNLMQTVFAALMAWFFLEELPSLAFWPASLLVVGGVLLEVFSGGREGLPEDPGKDGTGSSGS